MAKTDIVKPSDFDFGESISVLFKQQGGRNFAIRLVLWSAIGLAIVFGLCAKPYMQMMGGLLEASWLGQQGIQGPEAMLNAYKELGKYGPMFLFATIGMWATYASAETALYKRVFKNIDHGFIPLRFGRDVLRTMGVQFMVYLMIFGVMILWLLGFVILAFVFALVASFSKVLAFISIILLVVMYVAMFVYLVYFSVRMAPSAAVSLQIGKAKITGGWGVTRKRTGNLFLAYLFIAIVGYVVMSIVQVMMFSLILSENYMLLIMGMSEESPRILFEQAAEKMKQPGPMLGLVIGGICYAITMIVFWLSINGVSIYAVQWWKRDQEASGIEVFD